MILYYINIKKLKINVFNNHLNKSNIKSLRILYKIRLNYIHFLRSFEFKTDYYKKNNAVKSCCPIDSLIDFNIALFK